MRLNFYRGRFSGILLSKDLNKVANVNYTSAIQWSHIFISEIEKTKENFDLTEQRVKAYWYTPELKTKTKWYHSSKRPELFFPKNSKEYYAGNLKNVLVNNFERNENGSIKLKQLSKDLFELKGDIFFSVPEPQQPKSNQVLNNTSGTRQITVSNPIFRKGFGFNNLISVSNFNNSDLSANQSRGGCFSSPKSSSYSDPTLANGSLSNVSNPSNSGLGCFSWVGRIFRLCLYGFFGLLWISLLLALWNLDRNMALLLLIIGIAWAISSFLHWKRLSKFIGVLAVMLMLGILGKKGESIKPVIPEKTKDGTIKTEPPKDTERRDEDGSKLSDKEFKKHIDWFDFNDSTHSISFNTYSSDFISSKSRRRNEVKAIVNARDPVKYFRQLYSASITEDRRKLDSFIYKLKKDIKQKKYDKLDASRSIVTFIQEIPYVLVHDESCEVVVKQDPGFVADYHREGKPCLPGIEAGFQTPYEFLHNLKGDCDTRALLAHAIHSQFDIPSAVLVSMQYGHSILAVGLPVASGHHIDIGGRKYYCVELTAKGYDLGMISPSQANMANWDVTIYN